MKEENKAKTEWVGTWSSSAASAGIHIPPLIHLNNGLLYSTARSVICPTLSGDKIRIKLSNRFNKKPLHISETTVQPTLAVRLIQTNLSMSLSVVKKS